jgi:PAS domain S-box-containing protein
MQQNQLSPLELAKHVQSLGFWSWDALADDLYWSPELCALYGVDTPPRTETSFLSIVHPHDRLRVEAEISSFLADGETFTHEFRIVRPNGEIRSVIDQGRVERGPDGAAVRLTGVNLDVTALRTSQRPDLPPAAKAYQAAFDNAAIGLALIAPDGTWIEANDHLCKFLGRTRAELMQLTFQEITHPDDVDADVAQLQRVLTGAVDSYSMDKRYLRPDGEAVWGRLTVGCIRGEDGDVQVFVSAVEDISTRKAADIRQALVTRELNHRVKNLMSVVQSIARRTLDTDRPMHEARAVFAGRLEALARAQDVILQGFADKADLSQLLAEAIGTCAPDPARVRMKGPAVLVAPERALALTLIFHELCTNAVKHGALSNARGQVDVSWELLDPATSRVKLAWTESGGPRVDASGKKGFGSVLIQRALPLEARRLDMRPEGLVFEMTAELATAAPAFGV